MNRTAVSLFALALCCARASAQTDASRLQSLELKVDALTQELERLKLGETAEPVADGARPGQAPAASKVYRAAASRVSIGGYGEMIYQNFGKRRQSGAVSGSRDTIDFLRAVLYAGYKFSDLIVFNSELEFEHGSTTGAGARGEVSIEQAYVDFKLADPLGIRAGLLLVPMGLVNEIHEPTTFNPVRRPNVESNIIPTTWRENGAGLFGEWGQLSYKSFVVTGLQAVTNTGVTGFSAASGFRNGRSKGANSFAEDFAWTSRLDFAAAPGARAGASFYVGQADHGFTAASVPVALWDAHATLEYRGAELRALYAEGRIGNADAVNTAQNISAASGDSIGNRLFGGYVEAAFNVLSLTSRRDHLAPFFRYERYDTQARTPDLWAKNGANSRVEYTAGACYKPIPQVAVKADHQWMQNQARTGVNQWNFGLAYIF